MKGRSRLERLEPSEPFKKSHTHTHTPCRLPPLRVAAVRVQRARPLLPVAPARATAERSPRRQATAFSWLVSGSIANSGCALFCSSPVGSSPRGLRLQSTCRQGPRSVFPPACSLRCGLLLACCVHDAFGRSPCSCSTSLIAHPSPTSPRRVSLFRGAPHLPEPDHRSR